MTAPNQPATGTDEWRAAAVNLIVGATGIGMQRAGKLADVIAALSADNRAPVEDGWRLVPVEPTEADIKRVAEAIDTCAGASYLGWDWWINEAAAAWSAMLAAAPTPPTGSREARS